MRAALIVIGILIAALGIWIALGRFTYHSTRTEAQLGPLSVQTTQEKAVPVALGYLGIAIGAGLVIAGAVRKR
ncbi:MAG TPA: hypothetical protein VFK08_02420 [Rhodanobacteraceae bacterium]|nr:hypothetical protein [Rhodanobacteraceae bacterium]